MSLTVLYTLGVSLLVFLLSCIALYLSRGRRNRKKAPVVVTAATHQTNTAPRSYPVSQVPVTGTVNAGYQAQIYAAPYPTQNFPTQMPMPMPMPTNQTAPPPGVHPHIAPVLAMPAAASMHPPPYDVAVAGGPPMPGVTAYEKQSAYNPNFAN
ncbi:splicing factor 3B subunit 4-like isoform X2 [Glossina fuscipes]|uniref:Splicing factor 3B subunit 4-like isoform X2 n=1 Tax=Glossina fuscipes TaxID=7396 RepID=A0A9C6E101_9MUSC|nr:splicing factor 3B subunit 4-like isoform X2 [Glossina fuscipes]XP_037899238.1 splicing factor 3B subunit 4-like isoform X2 [Glossina fuscipes]